MELYHTIAAYNQFQKSVLTIGTFDGVHYGHQKILKNLVQNAILLNCKSVVLTFFPHPQMVLNENCTIKMLNTIPEKIELLELLHVDAVIVQPFNKEFSELSAEDFIKKIVVDQLNVKKIIIGHDHRFGNNRSANFDDLLAFGKKYNFDVEQISVEALDEIAISSTKIRNAILNNNFNVAKKYLGYSYFFSGTVVEGKKLGRTLNFPTANIYVEENYKLIPNTGVFVVQCEWNNCTFFGMMNIGHRPTLEGKNQTIEVHLFNFDNDIYHEQIKVIPLFFLRQEQKFVSIDALKNQLEHDKVQAMQFLENRL